MIYLDHAATTPLNREIKQSYEELTEKYFANPASFHRLGQQSAKLETMAREKIASLFKVSPLEVIFTSGATESNNMAIKGVSLRYLKRGKHLITSRGEHPSVLNAFKQLEEHFGFQVTYLPLNEKGIIELEDLKRALNDETILVSLIACNNETGAINDIESIEKLVHQYPKAFFHIDATQAIGKVALDYSKVDLLSLSAHKLNGYKGSGLLIKRKNVDLLPLLSGGGQEYNLRSGTNNFPLEVALAKTLRIAFEKQKEHYEKVDKLRHHLISRLQEIEGIKLNSTLEGSPYIVNFSLPKKASVVTEALSSRDIYVSTKSACSSKKSPSSHVLKAMGKSDFDASNAIRVSMSHLNEIKEIDIFIDNLKEIIASIK